MKKDAQKIIREWLSRKLKERGRGVKSELADYLGIHKNAITKMINPPPSESGYRTIKSSELIKMAEFFNETPPFFEGSSSQAHQELYDLVDNLSEKEQENLLALVKLWLSRSSEDPVPPQKKERK